eukprot:165806_1
MNGIEQFFHSLHSMGGFDGEDQEPTLGDRLPKTMYHRMTEEQLKIECRKQGLSDTKSVRMMKAALSAHHIKHCRTNLTDKQRAVHARLRELGLTEPEKASACVKAGVLGGFISLDGDDALDKVIAEGNCYMCESPVKATLRTLLNQSDYCGMGYGCGGDGPIECPNDECDTNMYFTGMCCGDFDVSSGKNHNHCTVCPDFGECIVDYRNAHCLGCNDHFYKSYLNFPCNTCAGHYDSEECTGAQDPTEVDNCREGEPHTCPHDIGGTTDIPSSGCFSENALEEEMRRKIAYGHSA